MLDLDEGELRFKFYSTMKLPPNPGPVTFAVAIPTSLSSIDAALFLWSESMLEIK